MEKTKLHLQTEMEASPVDAPKKSNVILLNPEAFQSYITSSVTLRLLRASLDLIPPAESPFVVEDVSQNSWVKLLSTMNSRELEMTSPKGYVSFIVRSEAIDEIRRRKRKSIMPLPLDQEGEILQGRALLPNHEGIGDPAAEYELKEFVTEIVDEILQLPSKQMYGMFCVLKDEISPAFPLTEILEEHGIDIDSIHWPQEPKELQSLRSLIAAARKKLREKFSRPAPSTHSEKVRHKEEKEAVHSSLAPSLNSDREKREA